MKRTSLKSCTMIPMETSSKPRLSYETMTVCLSVYYHQNHVKRPVNNYHLLIITIQLLLIRSRRFQTLWFTDEVPVDCSVETSKDPTGHKTFQVSNDGSVRTYNLLRAYFPYSESSISSQVCLVVWIQPGSSGAPMHQTKSIDYGVLLEGEVVLELENGDERLLKPGYLLVSLYMVLGVSLTRI